MTDAQLKQLFAILFPDNNNREISEKDLRDGLAAFLDTVSARIGNLPNLDTHIKVSLVRAINEMVDRLSTLEDRFAPEFGEADPNITPPPGAFDYGSLYIQQQVIGGDVFDIGYWIYTNVVNVGWVNIISLIKPVYVGTADPNNTPPTGFDSRTGALYHQRVFTIDGVADLGFWIFISQTSGWLNLMAKEVEVVSALPPSAPSSVLYVLTTDNTIHRFQTNVFPPSWVQIGGSSGSNYLQVAYADVDTIPVANTTDVPFIIIDSTTFQKNTGAFTFDGTDLVLTPGYAATGQMIMIFRS